MDWGTVVAPESEEEALGPQPKITHAPGQLSLPSVRNHGLPLLSEVTAALSPVPDTRALWLPQKLYSPQNLL